MKVVFIIPVFNAAPHIKELIDSLRHQKNGNWEAVFIDDMSSDNTVSTITNLIKDDKKFKLIVNKEKKWALKNVVENSLDIANKEKCVIGILDGDDALCNENTVELILNEYQDEEIGTVWTGHKWDINNINISKSLPEDIRINPYEYPWVSSHLKTFRSDLLLKINQENFKDLDGNWFKRGYDQALYLPLIYLSKKRKYINEICYLYRINSNSIKF